MKVWTRFSVTTAVFLLLGLIVLAGANRGADSGASVVGVIKFDGPPPELDHAEDTVGTRVRPPNDTHLVEAQTVGITPASRGLWGA